MYSWWSWRRGLDLRVLPPLVSRQVLLHHVHEVHLEHLVDDHYGEFLDENSKVDEKSCF